MSPLGKGEPGGANRFPEAPAVPSSWEAIKAYLESLEWKSYTTIKATLEGLGWGGAVGAWTALEEVSGKLEAAPANQTPRIRTEGGGIVRLRGLYNAHEAVPTGTVLFKVPVGYVPAEEKIPIVSMICYTNAGEPSAHFVEVSGVTRNVTLRGPEVALNGHIALDGVTWSTT